MRELGGGLVLRRARPSDCDRIVALNCEVLANEDHARERVAAFTCDLLTRPHPTFEVDDYVLVEDAGTGQVVSALCTIPQTWSFDGIRFPAGRPELIATLPAYRNRGLIRAQFELIHEIGAARGEMLQAITGIPYFYRQFGYEMALSLGGGRFGYRPDVPQLKEGVDEPFVLRPASSGDAPLALALLRDGARRGPIACVRSEDMLRYEICGRSENHLNRMACYVVETPGGSPAGFVALGPDLWGTTQALVACELAAGFSWLAVMPSLIRHLWRLGGESASRMGKPFDSYLLILGQKHPAYLAAAPYLPHVRPEYAWYIRVGDLPAFLRLIAPALARRLAESAASGYSGELKICLGFGLHGRMARLLASRSGPLHRATGAARDSPALRSCSCCSDIDPWRNSAMPSRTAGQTAMRRPCWSRSFRSARPTYGRSRNDPVGRCTGERSGRSGLIARAACSAGENRR